MMDKKVAIVGIGVTATAIAVLSILAVDRPAQAQSSSWQYVVSASVNDKASTAWIVDGVNRKVIFCRQALSNDDPAQLPQFKCNQQPLP